MGRALKKKQKNSGKLRSRDLVASIFLCVFRMWVCACVRVCERERDGERRDRDRDRDALAHKTRTHDTHTHACAQIGTKRVDTQ